MRSIGKLNLLCPDYSDVVVSPLRPRPSQVFREDQRGDPCRASEHGTGHPWAARGGSGAVVCVPCRCWSSTCCWFSSCPSSWLRGSSCSSWALGASKRPRQHPQLRRPGSFSMQYSVYSRSGGGGGGGSGGNGSGEGSTRTRTRQPPAGAAQGEDARRPRVQYIPPPLGPMCKNPIYRSRRATRGELQGLHELKVTYSNHHLQQPPPPPAAAPAPVQLQPAGRTRGGKATTYGPRL